MNTPDPTITRVCRTCHEAFDICPAEQQFLRELRDERGWQGEYLPWHCVTCRRNRKRERSERKP
jgi:hypothetical protein